MKILCSKNQLSEGFRAVSSLVSSKAAAAGNQGILMEARDDQLLLKASDGEVTASHLIKGVKVDKGGLLMVDPVLGNLVMDLKDETVTMVLQDDESTIRLTAKGKDYDAPTMDPGQFTGLESDQRTTPVVFKAEVLRSAINRCAFAVAREPSRYAFHAILVDTGEGGNVNFVGSDGRRLSLVEAPADEVPDEKIHTLVPKRAFADFLKVMPPDGEAVRVGFSSSRMCLELGNTTVVAQIIDGKYPDYTGVIPKETKNKAVLPTKALEEALKRILLVSAADSPIARLIFYSHGELEINCAQGNKAGKESLEVSLEGEGGEISFNPVYVLDLLRAMERETVTLRFTDNQVPGRFEAGEDFTHIIMPITL